MIETLTDDQARQRIRTDLTSTLFVNAGAGSGKTASLVGRVVALVLQGNVPLRRIAAVTFTEKAAAELRDRLREEFERARTELPDDAARITAIDEALDDLDAAAIGTLHSFAQRILGEHPIQAGLPPLIEVIDEVASQVAFEHRWLALRSALLEEPDLRDPLLLALVSGVKLIQLRAVAQRFNAEWDRLQTSVLDPGPPADSSIQVGVLLRQAREVCELEQHCLDADDKMAGHLRALADWTSRLHSALDDAARLQLLAEAKHLKSQHGQKGNWSGCAPDDVRAGIKQVQQAAAFSQREIQDRVLRRLAYRIAEGVLSAARQRQREGRLEFHDLLVLSRELLRNPAYGSPVRQALSDRYERLLLDEFQDTDPIQIELALRIAGGAAADAADWRELTPPTGRLFVVGDPKQSIYRFRRADIATYLDAQSRIGERVTLSTNFRTTAPILQWVNAAFGRLIVESPGSQPGYLPLDEHRANAPGGTRMLGMGMQPHPSELRADDVREHEAADVAATIRTALAEKWQVFDEPDKKWRDLELDDIAILVPARTSLPQLEDALDSARIPYRAEASSLVYRTAEVRDLLMAARAIDDPSDQLALIAALRSPLFGCGDDDLWTWKQAGGSFNVLAPFGDHLPDEHPVRSAIDYLKGLQRQLYWLAPSQLLDRMARDRRMLEAAVGGPRARDVWRRLRFVIDQARAWTAADGGALRDYLAWARRQGDESARVAEAVLPETDAHAVRIMTIHAAKGLEFPVVILSGLSSQPGGRRSSAEVLWPTADSYELKLSGDVQTGQFDVAKPIDEEMGHHERLRLLYVGCTRARDHLVVSLHRAGRNTPVTSEQAMTNAELLAEASVGAPAILPFEAPSLAAPAPPPPADLIAPPSYAEWSAHVQRAQIASRRRSSVSASSLEGTAATTAVAAKAEPGLEKGPRNLELPPWNKGRYGTAIGSAVHGALQTVDLATGAGLAEAVHAQALAEGVVEYEDLVRQLCASAIESPTVQRAAARRHWRETYVGTSLEDGVLLEGYLDLLYEEDDGSIVVIDYKTDAVPEAGLPTRVDLYRPQLAAYATALRQSTGLSIDSAVLLFLAPAGCTERPVPITPGSA